MTLAPSHVRVYLTPVHPDKKDKWALYINSKQTDHVLTERDIALMLDADQYARFQREGDVIFHVHKKTVEKFTTKKDRFSDKFKVQ